MVNNGLRNISRFPESVPDDVATGGNRTITDKPIYDPDEVLDLARAESVMFWTRGARLDAAKWSLDTSDLSQLVATRHTGRPLSGRPVVSAKLGRSVGGLRFLERDSK
jgi:hypothetical protein